MASKDLEIKKWDDLSDEQKDDFHDNLEIIDSIYMGNDGNWYDEEGHYIGENMREVYEWLDRDDIKAILDYAKENR